MENPVEEKQKQDCIAQEFAVLESSGIGINKCVSILANKYDLSLTRPKLVRLRRNQNYIDTKKKSEEGEIELAKLTAVTGCAQLVPKMVKTLTKMLDEKGTQAVQASTLICKIVGVIDKEEDGQKQSQSISIVLPVSKKERVVSEPKKNIPERD